MGASHNKDDILELATRAKQAIHTPSSFMTEMLVQQQQYTCLSWLCHFNVLSHIPVSPSSISYQDLAQASRVPENTLRSVTRMVITMGFLCESSPSHVSHNALSAPFIEDKHLMTWLLHMVNHTVPFMNAFAQATSRFGGSTKTNETAFNIAFGTELDYFSYLKSRPDLEAEFDAYMQSQSNVHGGAAVEYLLSGFEWASLAPGSLIVDVGGGSGAASLAVAKAFSDLRFVVQDQATPINNARSRKTSASNNDEEGAIWQRIELREHDFFAPQPIKDAQIYLLRMIIHDWPDDKAVEILGTLASVLTHESRILIMDMVIPSPGSTSIRDEACLREKDLCMLQVFNAKERETGDWYGLIGKVDPPLSIRSIRRPDGSQHSVIEVSLCSTPV